MRIANIAIILIVLSVAISAIFTTQINYVNAVTVSIPDVCSNNLIQNQSEVTCYSDSGSSPSIGVHAECCTPFAGCISDIAACTISKPGTNGWFSTNEINSGFNYVSSGTDNVAPNFIACLRDFTGKCPTGYSSSTYEGYNCNIYKQKDADNIYSISGKWDRDHQECVTCNGAKINKTCSNTSSFFLDGSGNCSGVGQSGILETACGAAIDCDGKAVGAVCGSGTCDNNGACVVANALNLTINAATNPLNTGANTVVTFTVTDPVAGSAVSGAIVAVNSISCGTLPSPGLSNGSGQATSIFIAPGTAGVCIVNASASKTGYNAGSATYNINVTNPAVCSNPNYAQYNNYRYTKGQSIALKGLNPDASQNFYLCIYDQSGILKRSDPFTTNFPQTITFTATTIGTWKGLSVSGINGCPGSFDATKGCVASTDVVGCQSNADCTVPATCNLSTYACTGGGGGGGGNCASTMCGGANVTPCVCGGTTLTGANVWCGYNPTCNPGQGFASQLACQTACTGGSGPTCASGDGCLAGCTPPDTDCVVIPPPPPPPPPPPTCSGAGMFVSPLGPGYCTIGEILTKATEWILSLVASIIILILVIGGLMYISSAGDEDKLRTSKNIIQYAVIGLGIILISYALITEVTNILKGP